MQAWNTSPSFCTQSITLQTFVKSSQINRFDLLLLLNEQQLTQCGVYVSLWGQSTISDFSQQVHSLRLQCRLAPPPALSTVSQSSIIPHTLRSFHQNSKSLLISHLTHLSSACVNTESLLAHSDTGWSQLGRDSREPCGWRAVLWFLRHGLLDASVEMLHPRQNWRYGDISLLTGSNQWRGLEWCEGLLRGEGTLRLTKDGGPWPISSWHIKVLIS